MNTFNFSQPTAFAVRGRTEFRECVDFTRSAVLAFATGDGRLPQISNKRIVFLINDNINSLLIYDPHTQFDKAVSDFLVTHGLHSYLETLNSLVKQTFPENTRLAFRLEEFPDFEGERFIVDIVSFSSIETLLICYNNLLDKWIKITSPDIREWIRITILIFNI